MTRRFPIADLRTLAARALQFGTYKPSDSGRIRAVPDTRTIRYYTTLGLINRPSEMRGRTALYDENHVLQLVAIKRLQANDQTLSDIQTHLVGIPSSRLKKLADLPSGFWADADRYLSSQETASDSAATTTEQDEQEFWSAPAALPPSAHDSALPAATTCTRLYLRDDVQLIVDATLPTDNGMVSIDTARLQAAAAPLLEELFRQGLLKSDRQRDSAQVPPHAADSSKSPEESS